MKTTLLILWIGFLTSGAWLGYKSLDILKNNIIDEAGIVIFYIGFAVISFLLSGLFFYLWK